MSLTETEKRKIKEEEEYRTQLRSELSHGGKKKTSGFTKFITVLLIIFVGIPLGFGVLISIFTGETNTSSTSQVEEDKSDLVGNVNFDGTLFHIRNDEAKDWKNCWISLNSDYTYPNGAPTTKFDGVNAGETLDLTPGDFTLNDGTRFNAYTTMPKKVSISCGSRFGFWQWN